MIGVCAGYFRPGISLTETIIPCESNNHAKCLVCIPGMGSQLQISPKEKLTQSRKVAKGEKRKIKNIKR